MEEKMGEGVDRTAPIAGQTGSGWGLFDRRYEEGMIKY